MPWLKLLHITAVILWSGALLYLPAAIATASSHAPPAALGLARRPVLRGLFTSVATPAALLAIASGTAIFVWHGVTAPWLIAKLALVGLMVLGHALCGMLILRTERPHQSAPLLACALIALGTALWLVAIAWLVLRKPF